MAGLPNVPGVIAVDHRFTIGADVNVNSKTHFRYTGGPPSQANLNSIASGVSSSWATQFAQLTGSYIGLNEVAVQDLSDQTKPVGIDSTARQGQDSTAGQLPAAVCVVVGFRIARRYRGGHPRAYWPAFGAGYLAGPGAWKGNEVTALQSAWNAHVAAIKAISAGIVIGAQCSISYYSGSSPYTAANGKTKYRANLKATPDIDDITGIVVNVKPGSQRRRTRKA